METWAAGAERGKLSKAAIRAGRARNFQWRISKVLLRALDKTEHDGLQQNRTGGRSALSCARVFAVGAILLASRLIGTHRPTFARCLFAWSPVLDSAAADS